METIDKVKTEGGPRDVFLHLLAVAALYVSAGSFLALLFQFVNLGLPDVLEGNRYFVLAGARGTIRWSLASLVVVFPVYLWAVRFLHREYAAEPAKRELRIRRWLLYLTLFAAGLTVIGDLVSLLYRFLEGELTIRFVLKVLAVGFVAGAVLWYYRVELKGAPLAGRLRAAVRVVVGIVAVGVLTGFFVAGSPAEERARRTDVTRVGHLQTLQGEIVYYWQSKGKLPPALADLRDDVRGVVLPVDPVTGAAYRYEPKAPLTFTLCADFDRPSEGAAGNGYGPEAPRLAGVKGPYGPSENWDHGAGETCFERTIDPDFYRPPPR